MSKISELGPILGVNTRPEDLFVIVNLIQGDDGTKNITRRELVQAIQYEEFNRITITGGSISGVNMFSSTLSGVTINDSIYNRGEINNTQINTANIDDSAITNSTMEDSDIQDSTANNVVITNSEFNDGTMERGTGNNMVFTNSTIDNSTINNSTGNNNVFDNTTLNDVTIEGGTANNLILTNLVLDEVVMTDVEISRGTIDTVDISNSTIQDTDLDDVDITNSRFSNGEIWDTRLANNTITGTAISGSTFTSGSISASTANNITIGESVFADGDIYRTNIVDSDFSDGTGNNNVFTNTTIQDGTLANNVITDSSFQGTLDDVTATNMTIASSSSEGMVQDQSVIGKSTFDGGVITDSEFKDGTIRQVEIANSVIEDSTLVDFDMQLGAMFDPGIDENSFFAIRNEKTGKTEQISYAQLTDEMGRTAEKALKVHVAVDGDDSQPGSILKPVKTLKRAAQIALEKAGGSYDRNDINNAVHISVGPGTYYVDEPVALPDDCSMTSTSGQYATVIQKLPGWERTNGILVGSGCYVQGFSYMNFEVDNFDQPEGGFAIAYRPGALMRRSPYIRDSSQLSNFNRLDIEPPLNPFNSKGTILDLGQEFYLKAGHSTQANFEIDDEVTFSSGATGYISYIADIDSNSQIYVRNLKGNVEPGDILYAQRGGTGEVDRLGIDDFPNRLVGRGGGCVLCDRAVLDTDSLYTYLLCFGFTPRTQNGTGYVAKNGAGVNGIGSLSIFTRQAFFALDGGQVTLNNSGSQFGDISMRARGSTVIVNPSSVNDTDNLIANTTFADELEDKSQEVINDMIAYLTANTTTGFNGNPGLGYQGYNADKCFRDTGIIVDNVGYDVATKSNYWGRLNGITYRSPISYVVVNEQLTETVGSIEHLKDEIEFIFENANTQVNDRVGQSLNETLNILQNGEPVANSIIFTDTGVGARTGAREVVQDNREFIIEEFVDWIDNNPNFFAYDSEKCKRDVTDYILPAVTWDTMLDTNYNSSIAGQAYYFSQARAVAGAQRDETIAAYERLRLTTDDLVEANSAVFAAEAYEKFNEIIGYLKQDGQKFTPTKAKYDSATGDFVVTIGKNHGLEVGQYILLMPEAFTFTCEDDGNVLELVHPRKTDPAFKSALPITDKSSNSITVNVGSTGHSGAHTFVSALDNSVIVLSSDLEFSDDSNIPANRRNARKQLQANKQFIQDYMKAWADQEWFFYDSKKCERDTKDHIVPGVLRDMQLGTNYNSVYTGVGYRSPVGNRVVTDQLTETVGAITELKRLTSELKFGKEFTPTDASYDPDTGEFTATLGSGHGLEVGDYVYFANTGFTFSCDTGGGANNHAVPESHHRFYHSACPVTEVTSTVVTMNVGKSTSYEHTFVSADPNSLKEVIGLGDKIAIDRIDEAYDNVINIMKGESKKYTPTAADYYSNTGVMTVTIGEHDFAIGDEIYIAKEGLTFTCEDDSANTEHSYPRVDTFEFTPTGATYDPASGVFTATIGTHKLKVGDTVKFKPEGITFTCDQDNNATNHPVPESHHPFYNKECPITAVTSTTITLDVGASSGGTHTFVSAVDDAIEAFKYHPFYEKPITITNRTSTTITVNVGGFEGGSVHTFVRAKDDAIRDAEPYGGKFTPQTATYDPRTGDMVVTVGNHNITKGTWINIAPESIVFSCNNNGVTSDDEPLPAMGHPAYNAPVRISDVTSTTFTVNVGNAKPYTGEHTFVSAEADCIDTHAVYFTDAARDEEYFTPLDATYNGGTGVMEITLGENHNLTTDDHIQFKPLGITLSCANTVANTTHEISHPRIGEPNYEKPVSITAVSNTTITVNVGTAAGYSNDHTFVSAEEGAVVKSRVTRDGHLAREQLQANRAFLAEQVHTYLDENYFIYDENKCKRDTGFILDAVRRDFVTGSNVNSVYVGKGYRTGTVGANNVIENQLTETVGAIEWLRDEIATNILSGDAEIAANNNFDEIIDIMQNGNANADALDYGVKSISVEAFNARVALQKNKQFIQEETIAWIANNYPDFTYNQDSCKRDLGIFIDLASWDLQHGSNAATVNNTRLYFENAMPVLSDEEIAPTSAAYDFVADLVGQVVRGEEVDAVTSNTAQIFIDEEAFTPSTATYIPTTGVMTITIANTHTFAAGDRITIDPEGITFSCNTGGGGNDSHPNDNDPMLRRPFIIDSVTDETITINAGIAGTNTEDHTFVSATTNAVRRATMAEAYTPTDADYDHIGGEMTLTLGDRHRFVEGDYVIFDEEAITFSCPDGANTVNISHPRTTDPVYNTPVKITGTTETTITMMIAPAGVDKDHTFVSATTNGVRRSIGPKTSYAAEKLFRDIGKTIGENNGQVVDVIEPRVTAYGKTPALFDNYDGELIRQYEEVWGSTPKYQQEIIDHIREEYAGLSYDIEKCKRDVGYIVDAISEDMEYGGNVRTVEAARYYFEGAVNVLPYYQREPTKQAYEHLADVIEDVITETTVEPFFGTAYTPTDATYNPSTGEFTATIGSNSFEVGDHVWFKPQGITFSCNTGSGTQNHAVPESHHFYYEKPCPITAVNGNIITMYVGTSTAYTHTFVSADADSIKEVTTFNKLPQNKKGVAASATAGSTAHDLVEVISNIIEDVYKIEGLGGSLDDDQKFLASDGKRGASLKLPTANTSTIPVMEPSRTYARRTLQKNKRFIQESVVQFIDDHYYTYNTDKCARDTGYILDAVKRDVQTGGNYAGIYAGRSYRVGTKLAQNVIDEQLAETITAINYLRDDIEPRLSGAPLTLAKASFDNIINIMKKGTSAIPTYNFGTAYQNVSAQNLEDGLDLNRDFIIEEGIAYIATNYGSLVYDADKCRRDIGFMLDAVKFDILHGSNVAMRDVARLYFEEGINVGLPRDQRAPTAAVFEHLGAVAKQVVLKQTVSKSLSNAETQVTAGFSTASAAEANRVPGLWEIVADIIAQDSLVNMPDPIEPQPTTGTGYNNESSVKTIADRREPLTEGINDYIKDNFNYLLYDRDKCKRDTGFMVDGISHDIQYGGNSAMWNNAQIYFVNAINTLPTEQRKATREAFTHMAEVIEKVVRNEHIMPKFGRAWTPSTATYVPSTGIFTATIGEGHNLKVGDYVYIEPESIVFTCDIDNNTTEHPAPEAHHPWYKKPMKVTAVTTTVITLDVGDVKKGGGTHTFVRTTENSIKQVIGNTVAQQMTTVAADFAITAEAKSLAMMIADIADDNDPSGIPARIEPTDDWIPSVFRNEKNKVDDDLENLVTKMINYITKTYNGASYDKGKCNRDVGAIVDAISHDVNYGTNYATRIAAQLYFDWGASILPYDQQQQSADMFSHMASLMKAVVKEERGSGTSYTATDASYDPETGIFTATLGTGHGLETGDYVWFEPDSFTFSCDTGSGPTNHSVPESHHRYYNKPCPILRHTDTTITMQVGTSTAYDHTFVSALEDGLKKYVGTKTMQDFSGTPASATEGEEVADLVRIIEEAIRRNSVDAIPELQEPDLSWVDESKKWAKAAIMEAKYELAEDVTQFLRDNFTIIDYSKAKCRRDSGYIIDAISYDLNYGGNAASRWNADFYYWNNQLRIPENTRVATAQAYRRLGEIIRDVVTGDYPGQKLRPEMGDDERAKQAYDNGMIFYNALYFNSPKYLGPLIEPDFTWEDDNSKIFRFSRDILLNNKRRLQREVQRFITSEYKFIDLPKTYRDANNLIKVLTNDFRFVDPSLNPSLSYSGDGAGGDKSTRAYASAFFNIDAQHVFPVFNPPAAFSDWRKLRFKGTVQNTADLPDGSADNPRKRWDAYIVPTAWNGNRYDGRIYYFNGTSWIDSTYDNNTDLLDSFTGAWTQMKTYINNNIAPDAEHRTMITELIDNVLIGTVIRPTFLTFGSLVESIAHQFNGASAGVNRNALPLNFRNVGSAISATASVLSENGGRIRWSGADELNNQYFARGLRINGRTGRIEGRPFTSSVRKLARRASNSRAVL